MGTCFCTELVRGRGDISTMRDKGFLMPKGAASLFMYANQGLEG